MAIDKYDYEGGQFENIRDYLDYSTGELFYHIQKLIFSLKDGKDDFDILNMLIQDLKDMIETAKGQQEKLIKDSTPKYTLKQLRQAWGGW